MLLRILRKDRDYPITKVDRQNGRTVVSGETQYGKITAFFSKDGHSSIVWTNGKDVELNQCASETVLATQPPLQESRSEADAEATAQRDEAAAKRAESAASKAAARLEEASANRSEDGDAMLRNRPTEADTTIRFFATDPSQLAAFPQAPNVLVSLLLFPQFPSVGHAALHRRLPNPILLLL